MGKIYLSGAQQEKGLTLGDSGVLACTIQVHPHQKIVCLDHLCTQLITSHIYMY